MHGHLVEPVTVEGSSLPLNMPINTFGPSELPELPQCVFDNLQAAGHSTPTLLERSAVPVGLAGRDMIIVAGDHNEGQASSLLIPLVAPLVSQLLHPSTKQPSKLGGGNGNAKCCPQALLLAPTRHLLNEAVRVTETLTAKTPLEYALICGGSAGERTPSASARLLLATPGRLSELLEKGILTLDGISNVAIASLGAMVDLGFEPHLRRFFEGGANESGSIPPVQARQTLIAVTELPAPLRALAARLTRADVVELTCSDGWRAAACARDRVLQSALFAGSAQSKQATLAELVTAALAADNALVVVLAATRRGCYVLSYYLETEGISTVAVHSSTLKPREREATAERFVSGKARVLVATDAALRTLELSSRGAAIGQLVNFELCASKGEYLERLGYVGGAGHTGRLTTLVGDDDAQHNPKALAELVELLRASANDVPRWLEGLILQQVPP